MKCKKTGEMNCVLHVSHFFSGSFLSFSFSLVPPSVLFRTGSSSSLRLVSEEKKARGTREGATEEPPGEGRRGSEDTPIEWWWW